MFRCHASGHYPPCYLRQGLSQEPWLAEKLMQAAQQALGTHLLYFPSDAFQSHGDTQHLLVGPRDQT